VRGGLLESKWVGHSYKIFMKHYGNVQQADIVAACGTVANTLQHGGVPGGTEPPRTKKKGHLPLPAPQCNSVQPTAKQPSAPTRTRTINLFQRNQQQTGCDRCNWQRLSVQWIETN
jgi:hypothetical protein